MQLDHIFLFVPDMEAAEGLGRSLGLTETYRRTHPGQGTANICYCFENAFLELLVLTDPSEAGSPAIARTGLLQRSSWRDLGTCPVGMAWRLDRQEAPPSFATWPFRPPYLPESMHIPVAVESDDPAVPLLFQSPGTAPPLEWPAERRGLLQEPVGLRRLSKVLLTSPRGFNPGPVLSTVLAATDCVLEEGCGFHWSVRLLLGRHDGGETALAIER
jgi:hypothetical protein